MVRGRFFCQSPQQQGERKCLLNCNAVRLSWPRFVSGTLVATSSCQISVKAWTLSCLLSVSLLCLLWTLNFLPLQWTSYISLVRELPVARLLCPYPNFALCGTSCWSSLCVLTLGLWLLTNYSVCSYIPTVCPPTSGNNDYTPACFLTVLLTTICLRFSATGLWAWPRYPDKGNVGLSFWTLRKLDSRSSGLGFWLVSKQVSGLFSALRSDKGPT